MVELAKGLKTSKCFLFSGDIMALFGRKKKQAPVQPQSFGQATFPPVTPHTSAAPGQMTAPKGTLAQNLGLDKDVTKLPPLPSISPRDSAFTQKDNFPPLPTTKADDLPPLPDDLPPLPKTSVATATPKMAPMGPEPLAPEPSLKPAEPKRAPVFIRIDKYQEIIDTVNQMESRINNLQNAVKKIGDIKGKEKDILDTWSSLLSEAKQKVDNVNSKLPEAK